MRQLTLIAGADHTRTLDALFINAPLRDYTLRPRTNDYTLPVLGMAYIATYAQQQGFNVGVLDAEAHGLGLEEAAQLVNEAAPRWAAMNLLAPTYEMSARIAARLDPGIDLMVGGHHAKAMPDRILADPRMRRLGALVLGEGELRVASLLEDIQNRRTLPGVMWRDPLLGTRAVGIADPKTSASLLGPDINALPYVNRAFLPQDPYQAPGHRGRPPPGRNTDLDQPTGPLGGQHRRQSWVPLQLHLLRRRRVRQPRRRDPRAFPREHHRRARPVARAVRRDSLPLCGRPVPWGGPCHR